MTDKKVENFKGWFRLELTNNCWFQVHKNGTRDVFSCSGFAEKGVEGIVPASNGLIAWHLAIGLNSMLQAVKLPTGITNLHSGLADMNWDTLTLWKKKNNNKAWKLLS